MRIHYLQHVSFEGLGSLAATLLGLGHTLTCTRLYAGEVLPDLNDFDSLIVMGGPMGVYDSDRYPWLDAEKLLIRRVINDSTKPLLGICLGAQLIAAVLGAAVTRNPEREIGWFPLHLDPAFINSRWGDCLHNPALVFHWHGDTFALPVGAMPVGCSAACRNQGFILDERIIGLQFHLETTAKSTLALLAECADELDGSVFVQSAEEIMADNSRFNSCNDAMARIASVWLRES